MRSPEPVKCLVWDLDHTVWAGTLLESARSSSISAESPSMSLAISCKSLN